MRKQTIYFLVETPNYRAMACCLAASLRENFGDTVDLGGYFPVQKIDLVHPEVKAALTKMRCDLRKMVTNGRFDQGLSAWPQNPCDVGTSGYRILLLYGRQCADPSAQCG